jgi:hypothetical protein
MQIMALEFLIENDNGWFYTSGKYVVLCEYVLHIFHENTYNDI